MNDQPIGKIDPQRLKEERHDVDFGTSEETGHDHISREQGRGPRDKDDPVARPTGGATPPAR